MIIINNRRNFIFIRPWSVLKILFREFRESVLIQIQDLVGHTLVDHVAEIHKEFLDLKAECKTHKPDTTTYCLSYFLKTIIFCISKQFGSIKTIKVFYGYSRKIQMGLTKSGIL